jgi:hypothetical protein
MTPDPGFPEADPVAQQGARMRCRRGRLPRGTMRG